jgi:hypothetical protein
VSPHRRLLRFGGGQVIATLPHHFEIDEEGERCEARYKDQREPVLVAASRCGASSFHRRRPSDAKAGLRLQCLQAGQHQFKLNSAAEKIVIVIRTTAGESGAGAVHQQRLTLKYICLNNST